MDDIVSSHAKNIEGLSHHLGRMADLFEDVMDGFLSKEREFTTNVQWQLQKEIKELKESVKEWEERYKAKEKELEEMKTGYTKLWSTDPIDEDLLWLDKLDLTPSETTPQDPPQPQAEIQTKKIDINVGSYTKSICTTSKDKGKAPTIITPPKSNRKIITTIVGNKANKSSNQPDDKTLKKRKRKIVPSSDDNSDDNLATTFRKYRRPGLDENLVDRPVASSSKNRVNYEQGAFSKNVNTESEWDHIALQKETKKRNPPVSHQKKKGWDSDVIDLTL